MTGEPDFVINDFSEKWNEYFEELAEEHRLVAELKMTRPERVRWYGQQASLYAQAMVASYAKLDAAYTMEWWRNYCGDPVLVNKLRPKGDPILRLNDLIHPETLAKMTRPLPRSTAYPDYGWYIV